MSGDLLHEPEDGQDGVVEAPPSTLDWEGFDALPAKDEWYEAVCMRAIFGRSQASGNPMITLTISDPLNPAAHADLYVVRSPKAKWRADQAFKAFGIPIPEAGQKTALMVKDFVGKKVRAKSTHEEYRGERQFKWSELAPSVEGAGARAFDPDNDADIPF